MYVKVHGPITHEAGNMAEWSTATNAVASTTGAITGTYSGRAGSGVAAAVTMSKDPIAAEIGGRCSRVYIKAKWRPRQTPVGGQVNVLGLIGNGGNALVLTRSDGTGTLSFHGATYAGIVNGTVYDIEMMGLYDGRGYLLYGEVWIDGVKQMSTPVGTTVVVTTPNPCKRADGPSNGGAGKITQDDCIDGVEVYVSDPWS